MKTDVSSSSAACECALTDALVWSSDKTHLALAKSHSHKGSLIYYYYLFCYFTFCGSNSLNIFLWFLSLPAGHSMQLCRLEQTEVSSFYTISNLS